MALQKFSTLVGNKDGTGTLETGLFWTLCLVIDVSPLFDNFINCSVNNFQLVNFSIKASSIIQSTVTRACIHERS